VVSRVAIALLALSLSFAVAAQIRIGLMVSATGPTTAIGIPQQNTGALLPTRIGDAKRRWVFKTTQNDEVEGTILAAGPMLVIDQRIRAYGKCALPAATPMVPIRKVIEEWGPIRNRLCSRCYPAR